MSRTMKLDDIAKIERGRFSPRPRNDPRYYGGDIPFVQTGDVSRAGTYIQEYSQTLNKEGLAVSKLFPKDTILMTIAANVGDVSILNFDSACPDSLVAFTPKEGVSNKWLFHVLSTMKNFFDSLSTQNAQKNLSLEKIKPVKVQVPSYEAQIDMASTFDAWDTAIEKTEALVDAKERQFGWLRSQLIKACQGEIYKLEELEALKLIKLGRGDVISKKDFEKYPGSYPVYSSSVKRNGVFGKYGKFMFEQELITWSVDGGGDFFYRPKHKFSVTNVCGYMTVKQEQIDYAFFAAQLQLLHTRLVFDYQFKAHPSVIRKIYKVKLPPLEEQKRIAHTLNTAQQEIKMLKNLVEKYHRQKRGLMQKLLSGEWQLGSDK